MELMQASRQWAKRPADERFTNLHDLHAAMTVQRDKSASLVIEAKALRLEALANKDKADTDTTKGLVLVGPSGKPAAMSNYVFSQLCTKTGVPLSYAQDLPAELVALNINHGLRKRGDDDGKLGLLLTQYENATGTPLVMARALTGDKYGRVWNNQVTNVLCQRFGNGVSGQWKVPGEFGKAVRVTKANTTIFGGDRDMFVFLADETKRVTIDNRRNGQKGELSRGFFIWNSEVGSATLGIKTFLFDYACSNRIVWGASKVMTMRMKHYAGIGDRWYEELAPKLASYAEASTTQETNVLKLAQASKIDDLAKFLKPRTPLFSQPVINNIAAAHMAEEQRPIETLWDVVTGITAFAKSEPYQDKRIVWEAEAGKILDLVAN